VAKWQSMAERHAVALLRLRAVLAANDTSWAINTLRFHEDTVKAFLDRAPLPVRSLAESYTQLLTLKGCQPGA
jgi:hypothetical protein